MSRFLQCLALLVLVSTFQIGHASELSITIEQAIKNNYKIRVSEYEVISSEYDRKKGLSAFFPTINASANTKWNDSDTLEKENYTSTKNGYNSNGYSISLSQSVIDLSKVYNYQVGELDYEINLLKHHKIINDIIINVVEGYFSYLKYHSQYIATESELISSETRFKHVQRSHELGNVAKTDVYEAYAKKEGNVRKLADIEKNLEVALLKLQSTTQIKMIPSVDVKISENYENISTQEEQDLQGYMLTNNYDIIIAEFNTQKSIKTSEKSRSSFYPTVSASVNYEFTDSNNSTGTDTDNIVYSLDLTLPITNGGSDLYTYQRDANKIEQSNIQYEQTLDDSEVSFKELIYDINNNVNSMRTLKSMIISNYAVYKGSQRAYKIGTKTLTDLLGAESNLYNSIRDFQENQYNYIINVSKLKALLGPINLQEIEQLSSTMVPLQKRFDITLLEQFKGVL
ncbi:outer membrane channel protein TolC [Psychromonas marina]|uniref:Outer membrane channel protein TolC n=1 Tax=Psychromonas marina TaxID=88364 RepID=A0ABQ6E2Q6_9GAMM|nr:TolC family protein [Psychromonas marina]GLS91714.1 outer membrane channel protein TolC [Psychromonas marina]